jgi:uncharacterized membrane protein YqhA
MAALIFLRLRYLAVVMVALFVLHAIGLLVVGAMRAYEAYHLILQGPNWTGADRPGLHIAESIDALLFSLVLIVVASGTASLFLSKPGAGPDPRLPAWINVRDLSHLKFLIWEAMLVVLVVATLTMFISNLDNLFWQLLTLPAAIFLLSAGLYLVKRSSIYHPKD